MTDLVARTPAPVRTEINLHVLACGLKRVARSLGGGKIMSA